MAHPNDGFKDNWAYLKTELSWLDRMLMMALARYRQDKKTVDRFAQTPADKASAHWWKGVITVDGKGAYDEHRPPTSGNAAKDRSTTPDAAGKKGTTGNPASKLGYQQQLDLRIKASQRNGITLALPWLRDRLQLSLFEKNLILMALAPEVNRRYARLYRYLQSHDESPMGDLPTVELLLRLLCRNDQEWRQARCRLTPDAPLIRHELVLLLYQPHDPFINATVRLADELVDWLLAETPDPQAIEALLVDEGEASMAAPLPLEPSPWALPPVLPVNFSNELSVDSGNGVIPAPIPSAPAPPVGSAPETADAASALSWDAVVLPKTLRKTLQHLGQHVALTRQLTQTWPQQSATVAPGMSAIFAGPSAGVKHTVARVLAQELGTGMSCINVADIAPEDYDSAIANLDATVPTVLLIQSAEHWLRRTSALPAAHLSRFLHERQGLPTLTLMAVTELEAVATAWQHQVNQVIPFPSPTKKQRQHLWNRAFPPTLKLARTLDWAVLSAIPLQADDIEAIAHDAMIRMMARQAKSLRPNHLEEALRWHQVSEDHIHRWVEASRTRRSKKKSASSNPRRRRNGSASASSGPASALSSSQAIAPAPSDLPILDDDAQDPTVAESNTPPDLQTQPAIPAQSPPNATSATPEATPVQQPEEDRT